MFSQEMLNYVNINRLGKTLNLTDAINWGQISKDIKDFDFVKSTLFTYPWNPDYLVLNPNLTIDFVEFCTDNNYYLEKGQYGLSGNPNMYPLIEMFPDAEEWYWGVGGISINPSITEEFIKENIDKLHIGVGGLSNNPCITLDFVKKYNDWNWDWGEYGLSRTLKVSYEEVLNNPDLPWDDKGLECNLHYQKSKKRDIKG